MHCSRNYNITNLQNNIMKKVILISIITALTATCSYSDHAGPEKGRTQIGDIPLRISTALANFDLATLEEHRHSRCKCPVNASDGRFLAITLPSPRSDVHKSFDQDEDRPLVRVPPLPSDIRRRT